MDITLWFLCKSTYKSVNFSLEIKFLFVSLNPKLYWLSSKNSLAATSNAIPNLPDCPALFTASRINSTAWYGWSTLGANPPSSPTFTASCPYFFFIIPFKYWKTSAEYKIASNILSYFNGTIINSWNAILFPACFPPLITLKHGIGNV